MGNSENNKEIIKFKTSKNEISNNMLLYRYKELILRSEKGFDKFSLDDWNWWFYLNLEFWNIKEIEHSFNIFYNEFLKKLNLDNLDRNSKNKLYTIFLNLYLTSQVYVWELRIKSIDFRKQILELWENNSKEIDYLLDIEVFLYKFLLQDEDYLKSINKKVKEKLKLYDSNSINKNYIRYIKLSCVYYISMFFINKDEFDKKKIEIINFINEVNLKTKDQNLKLWWSVSFLKDILSYILYKQYWISPILDKISSEILKNLSWKYKEDDFEKIVLRRYEEFENKLFLLDFLILKLFFDVSKLEYSELINIQFKIVQNLFHIFWKNKFNNIYFKKLEKIEGFPKGKLLENVLKISYELIMTKTLNDLRLTISYKRFDLLWEVLNKLLNNIRIIILDENWNIKSNNWFSEKDVLSFKDIQYLTNWWIYIEKFKTLTLVGKKFCFRWWRDCFLVFIDRGIEGVNKFSYEELKILDKVLYIYFGLELVDSSDVTKFYNEFIRDLIIGYLSKFKDPETEDHMERVWKFTGAILGMEFMKKLIYDDILYVFNKLWLNIKREEIGQIIESLSPWHDIWKIEIPDNILNKPWKLTKEEFEAMKYHTILGASYIENWLSIDLLKKDKVILSLISLIHHLVFRNYPIDVKTWEFNLSKEVIDKYNLNKHLIESFIYSTFFQNFLELYKTDPKFRRWILFLSFVVGFADAFDAMNSKRVYKSEFDIDKIKKFLKEDIRNFIDRIAQTWDKELLEVFKKIEKKVDLLVDLLANLSVNNIKDEWFKTTGN